MQKNAHNHHHQAGHEAQRGGVRLHGLKVGRNGTSTGGKTAYGQTNGEVRQHRLHVQIAAGNSIRRRQVQRCHNQRVSLTAVMHHFSSEAAEAKHQRYKGRVVLRSDIVKDDSGSYAVFTERGSSASQIKAAKVMDVIARTQYQTAPKSKWKMHHRFQKIQSLNVQEWKTSQNGYKCAVHKG